jgi:hypothetical protein
MGTLRIANQAVALVGLFGRRQGTPLPNIGTPFALEASSGP